MKSLKDYINESMENNFKDMDCYAGSFIHFPEEYIDEETGYVADERYDEWNAEFEKAEKILDAANKKFAGRVISGIDRGNDCDDPCAFFWNLRGMSEEDLLDYGEYINSLASGEIFWFDCLAECM